MSRCSPRPANRATSGGNCAGGGHAETGPSGAPAAATWNASRSMPVSPSESASKRAVVGRALRIRPASNSRRVRTLTRLGDNHRTAGDLAAARVAWREALEILTELGHRDVDAVRARLARLD